MNYGYGAAQTPWPYYNNYGFANFGGFPWQAGYGPAFTGAYPFGAGFQLAPTFPGGQGFGFGGGYPQPAPWQLNAGYGTYPFGTDFGQGFAWTSLDDDQIKQFVEDSLDNDTTIPPGANVDVQVQNGVVTLTGTVPNKRIKHAAGDDAWWLPQVLDVHNEINVVSRRERAGTSTSGRSAETGRTSRRGQAISTQTT